MASKSAYSALCQSTAGHFYKNLNQKLTARSSLVSKSLTEKLPPGFKFKKICGGMYLWLTLPPEISADDLLSTAHNQGIHYLLVLFFILGPNSIICESAGRIFPMQTYPKHWIYFARYLTRPS